MLINLNNAIVTGSQRGFSVEGEKYYIYILRLSNDGWYVGSTKNIYNRMLTHFSIGGSIATKEFKPVRIEKIFTMTDYMIGSNFAHRIAEVLIANKYAKSFGYDKIRGAKHGKSWNEYPNQYSLKIIKRYQGFARKDAGRVLRDSIAVFDHTDLSIEINSFLERKNDRDANR